MYPHHSLLRQRWRAAYENECTQVGLIALKPWGHGNSKKKKTKINFKILDIT